MVADVKLLVQLFDRVEVLCVILVLIWCLIE